MTRLAALGFLLLAATVFIVPLPLNAVTNPAPSTWAYELIPSGCIGAQKKASDCGLAQMVEVAVNASKIMLGLLGSVTLLVFIYGGFVWLTAAGNSQRVEEGRKALEGALIGLTIVLTAWVVINFAIGALTGTTPGENVQLFPASSTPSNPFQATEPPAPERPTGAGGQW